jgi:hypothetical protein
MKKKVTNFELAAMAGECSSFKQMFPFLSEHYIGVDTFLNRNAIAINRIAEKQHQLLTAHVVFKDGVPEQELVGNKIVDVSGKPQEQPTYDLKFKSEQDKDEFNKAEDEFKNQLVEITI